MEQAEPQPFESEPCASTLQLRLGRPPAARATASGAVPPKVVRAATMAGRFRHSTISDSKRSLSALKSSSVRSSKSQPRWSHRSTRCPTISWGPAEGQALLGQVVGHIRRGQIALLRLERPWHRRSPSWWRSCRRHTHSSPPRCRRRPWRPPCPPADPIVRQSGSDFNVIMRATRSPTTRPDLPRMSSAKSGFFFWGMIEEPVE